MTDQIQLEEASRERAGRELTHRRIIKLIKTGVYEPGHWHGLRQKRVWVVGPLYWLQNFTYTYDEQWEAHNQQPYRRFPRKPYFPWLFYRMATEKRLFIPKSREMMISWAVTGWATYAAQFHERTRVIIQSQKQDKANELVTGRGTPGYCRTLWEKQDEWLKDRYPLKGRVEDLPGDKLTYNHNSQVQGVPSGADQVRLYHPTIFIMDEAAHVDEAEASYDTANPVCPQIILVSSAAPSWFGDVCEE